MTITPDAVEKMTLAELRDAYNTLRPEKPIKKFASRATGIRRVLAALPEPSPGEAAEPAARTKGARGRGQRVFRPEGDLRPPRDSSKRGQLLARLLDDGMNQDEMEETFGWSPRDCMDALRLLAKQNGYVVSEGADGRWHAAAPD